MRIHSDTLTGPDVLNAMVFLNDAELIPHHVGFEVLTEHRSRKRARAFEVKLNTYVKEPGDGRSWRNSGRYGAGAEYAATYDEWGYFLAALFRKDPALTIPSAYPNIEAFIRTTSEKRNTRQKCTDYFAAVAEKGL
jgi:hypothetical protein